MTASIAKYYLSGTRSKLIVLATLICGTLIMLMLYAQDKNKTFLIGAMGVMMCALIASLTASRFASFARSPTSNVLPGFWQHQRRILALIALPFVLLPVGIIASLFGALAAGYAALVIAANFASGIDTRMTALSVVTLFVPLLFDALEGPDVWLERIALGGLTGLLLALAAAALFAFGMFRAQQPELRSEDPDSFDVSAGVSWWSGAPLWHVSEALASRSLRRATVNAQQTHSMWTQARWLRFELPHGGLSFALYTTILGAGAVVAAYAMRTTDATAIVFAFFELFIVTVILSGVSSVAMPMRRHAARWRQVAQRLAVTGIDDARRPIGLMLLAQIGRVGAAAFVALWIAHLFASPWFSATDALRASLWMLPLCSCAYAIWLVILMLPWAYKQIGEALLGATILLILSPSTTLFINNLPLNTATAPLGGIYLGVCAFTAVLVVSVGRIWLRRRRDELF